MKTEHRILALLLTLVIILGCMPSWVLASDEVEPADTEQEQTITELPVVSEDIPLESDTNDTSLPSETEEASESEPSLGTWTDPETGIEYPILSSVEDIIPEEFTDEEIVEGFLEVMSETAEDEILNTVVEDENEEASNEIEIPDNIAEMDFSSRRILVSGANEDPTEGAVVLASYDDVTLIQFNTEEEAMAAYTIFSESPASVEVDAPVVIADEVVSIEEADVSPVAMDTEDNPLTALNDILDSSITQEPATPSGKRVALIDTGASESTNVVARYSVLGDDVSDGNGHGSAMAAQIASVNPDMAIISIKALDAEGHGSMSSLYAAVKLAIELDVDIINLSVYAKKTDDSAIVVGAIEDAINYGITVVGAAGNSGTDAGNYVPGCVANAEIAGAVDSYARLHSYSNYGSTVDYYVMCQSSSYAAAVLSGYLSAQDDIKYALAGSLILEPEFVLDAGAYVTDERDIGEIYSLVMSDVANGTFTVASNDISRLITSGVLSSDEADAVREHYGIAIVSTSEVGLDYTTIDEALESGQVVTAAVFDLDKVDHWIYTTDGYETYPGGAITYKYVLTAYDSSGRVLGSFTATCTDPKKSAPSGSTTVYNYNADYSTFTRTAALIMFSAGYFGWSWNNSDTTKAWNYITDINTYVAAHEMMALAWHGATPSNVDSIISTYSKFTSDSRRTQIKNAYLAFYEASKTTYSWMKQYTVFYMSSSNSIYQTLVWMAQTSNSVSFNIQKRASSTSGTLLSGATFKVYEYDWNSSEWNLFATLTNSSGGYYTISGMTSGWWYQVIETSAPSGYQIDDSSPRYFKAPTSTGTIPTFYNSPTESSSYVISNGHIWVDTPVTTTPTPPPPPVTPTPTPPPEPLPDLGTLTITKVGNMVKSKSSNWSWDATASKWASGNLEGVTFEVWTGSTAVTTNSGKVIFAANTKVTNNATYGVTGFNSSGQVVTGSNGKCSVTLPYGSYVIKEISAPIGYVKSNDENVTISSSSTTKTITNKPVRIAVRVTKKDDSSGKVLSGAVFGLYAGENIYTYDGKTLLWAKDALIGQGTSGTNGQALYNDFDWLPPTSVNRTTGYKYYVKEITPPAGYKSTDYVYEFTASTTAVSGTADIVYEAEFADTPFVPVRIHKTTVSGYSDWITNNSCYDLSGTQFAVYDNASYASANTTSKRVSFDIVDTSGNVITSNQTILTVASNGYTPYIRLEPGKHYWIREIATGSGYIMPSNPVTAITVGTTSPQEFTISNTPGSDPTALVLYKSNKSGTNNKPLSGAIFSIEYFSGYYNSESAARAASGITHRTWYVTTKASSGNNAGKYVAILDSSYFVTSGIYKTTDALFKDGSNVVLPYGTLIIKEVQAADEYLNDANFGIYNSSTGTFSQTGKSVFVVQERPDGAYGINSSGNFAKLSGPVGVGNTSLVTDTQMPTASTMLTGDGGTKEPIAYHSVTLTDTVTISDLDDFQSQNIRVEGHLYLVDLDGTTTREIGNGQTTASSSLYVNAMTKQVTLSYTFDAWELHGRTIVAYVEVYDSSNRLICSHKDVGDKNQQITFTELGKATFYKHGEQLTGVNYNPDGTVTFQYEDIGLSGVKFQVVAAENVVKADGTTVYTAGTVVRNNLSPEEDGTLTLEDLQYGKYKLVEIETDGKHTVVADTPFEVDAYSGGGTEVDHDIPNTRKTITVDLTKVQDANTSVPVEGARYALYAKQNITDYAGTKLLDKDALVAYAVTGADGSTTFDVDLPVGFKWYVKELYVPAGYTLDTKEYEVSFTDTDSDTETFTKHVDGSDGDNKVTDEQQPGSLIFIKQDTEGHKLSGATYKLEYSESENGPWAVVSPYANADHGVLKGKAYGVNANGELTTGNDGKAEFTGLLADGTIYYRVTEVRTPDGYQLLEEPIYVGTLPQTADETMDLARHDVNGDGIVDDADLALLDRAISGAVTLPRGKGDIDANGAVNRNDRQALSDFLTQYHKQNVSSGDTPFNRRYILDYSVTNGGVFKLPHTGSSDFRWIWMVFAFAGMLMSGSVVIIAAFKRKRFM